MTSHEQHDASVRQPQPDAAAHDLRNAATQEQLPEDSEANRREAARRRATTPNEVTEETVAEISADAEARAKR